MNSSLFKGGRKVKILRYHFQSHRRRRRRGVSEASSVGGRADKKQNIHLVYIHIHIKYMMITY